MLKTSVVLLALAALSVSQAQQVRIYQDGRPERIFKPLVGLVNSDISFLKKAAICNRFEIEASKIALENGTGDFTREYAKEMIDEHQAAQIETVQTAQTRGVSLNSDLPSDLQHQLNALSALHGDQFNAAYREAQKQGHEAAIHLFQREIENGRDEEVKAMAVKQLPEIEIHYKMALIKRTMMGPTKMDHGT